MQKTINILVIIVVFLLGTNIAVIGNYYSHLRKERRVMIHRMEMPDFQTGQYYRDALQLNNEQIVKFRQYRQSYNRQANRVLAEMQTIRSNMLKNLESVTPDYDKLHTLSDELGDKHKVLKELTFEYYFNLQGALEPAQQKTMADIFQAMLAYEGHADTPNHRQEGVRRDGLQNTGRRYQHLSTPDTTEFFN